MFRRLDVWELHTRRLFPRGANSLNIQASNQPISQLANPPAHKRGQTMVEYVLMVLALSLAIGAAAYFIRGLNRQTEHTHEILGSEFP